MAHQFVFTSLEKTLGGGPGFGIVGISPGFPEALRTRSLGLVSYEGLASQTRAPGILPPVNWLGLKIDAGTKAFFVLGRVGSAPNDYSGRRNHIAHLVFLDPSEAETVHPASILREFPWIDSWLGPARPLPVPVLNFAPTVAPTMRQWLRFTGDGGYAGAPWDAMENGRPFAFAHEGLDPATLRELVIETLSQATTTEAWQLKFATLAGDFNEGKNCDLAGAAQGSRLAEQWFTQRIPHIQLGPIPRSLPKTAGPWADAARNGRAPMARSQLAVSNPARVRPTASILPSEAIELGHTRQESDYLSPQSAQFQGANNGLPMAPGNTPPDPMRLLIPGGIGFFLGMLFTGALVGLGIFSYSHLRDREQAGQKVAADPPPQNEANPDRALLQKGEKPPPDENKGNIPGANPPLENKQPPKLPVIALPGFLSTPVAMAKMAVGLFAREPIPNPEMEAQARLIRKLKNMQGFNAIEKDLIRADRVWELSRILQTVLPPLKDPFTHDALDKLTTPKAEDAWVVEAASLVPFGTRENALAYLSLVANRDRILVRVKKIEERTKGDQTLAPHLQKLKDSIDLYKNH